MFHELRNYADFLTSSTIGREERRPAYTNRLRGKGGGYGEKLLFVICLLYTSDAADDC